MHALAGNIRAHRFCAPGHFVELIEKYDAVLLDRFKRSRLDIFLIEHFCGFFVRQKLQRCCDLEFLCLLPPARQILKHALKLARHLFHSRRRHYFDTHRHCLNVDLYFLVVELALTKHLAELLSSVAVVMCIVTFGGKSNAASGSR